MISAHDYDIQRYVDDERIVGLLAIRNDQPDHHLLSGFDVLLLVITEDDHDSKSIHHYIRDHVRIQERWLHIKDMERWVVDGECRSVIQWLLDGEILIDRNGYIHSLRDKLLIFDQDLREMKLFKEFSLFLKTYQQSKDYLKQHYLLDAYSYILAALHHWARIAVIETGTHPEVIVWQQVRKINPGVYKLYDELTHSEETLEQRVQLLVLACEFTVVSKMKECCKLLLRILGSRDKPWSVMELSQHRSLSALQLDLSPILKKLSAKSLVREVAVVNDVDSTEAELQYCVI